MRLAGHLLRFYSYVFETVLCCAGLLLAVFSLANPNIDVRVPWLPWGADGQIRWIAGLSIAGILSVALAAFGMVRTVLFLFSVAVLGVLTRGLFLSTQYAFAGQSDARNGLILVLAALMAMIGSYPGLARRQKYKKAIR